MKGYSQYNEIVLYNHFPIKIILESGMLALLTKAKPSHQLLEGPKSPTPLNSHVPLWRKEFEKQLHF